MYGDPSVSWSIAIDVALSEPANTVDVQDRCGALAEQHPHLGRPPGVRPFDEASAATVLAEMLDAPYGDQDPLVRVALARGGRRLLVAGHHGALDGLGLLATLSILLDQPVLTRAAGIGQSTSRLGFIRSTSARLIEALFTPPDRVARSKCTRVDRPPVAGPGDFTARIDLSATRVNTAAIVAATARAVGDRNSRHGAGARRLVAAVGASRRDGSRARPDRDTAYLRIRLPRDLTESAVRNAIASTPPEPAFPERSLGRTGKLVIRALRARLGSSLLVSNLGVVPCAAVEQIALYPSAAGPQALAVGVASTSSYTTVTVRMPRADFSQHAADEVCAAIARQLVTATVAQ
jgi:hypothetical protein